MQNHITAPIQATRRFHSFERSRENVRIGYCFGRSGKMRGLATPSGWESEAGQAKRKSEWVTDQRNQEGADYTAGGVSEASRPITSSVHLQKAGRARWREIRSCCRLSWGLRFYAPSEGEMKTRQNCTPSEGGMGNSFGRSEGNTRVGYTFRMGIRCRIRWKVRIVRSSNHLK